MASNVASEGIEILDAGFHVELFVLKVEMKRITDIFHLYFTSCTF